MAGRVLITGSMGLIGRALRTTLAGRGIDVVGLDLRADGRERGDVRCPECVRSALDRCEGVFHLAAVSRVAWAERDPGQCRSVNVDGLHTVLAACEASAARPWLVFASSREVYGHVDPGWVDENASLRPANAYARSKVDGESLVERAREDGLRAAIVRLSNVYGGLGDHVDRVVPAFVDAALDGTVLRVEGSERAFDFTYLPDVVSGLVAVGDRLLRSTSVPTLQLVSGTATTLGDLAAMIVELAASRSRPSIREAPGRSYDVSFFAGDPSRAATVVGWRSSTGIREGLRRYIAAVRDERRRSAGSSPAGSH